MLKSRNIIFGRFLLKLIDLSCFSQSLIFKLIYLTLSVPRGVLHSHGSIVTLLVRECVNLEVSTLELSHGHRGPYCLLSGEAQIRSPR